MKRIILIIAAVIFVAGIGVMSYPLVSSVVNNIASRNSAESYTAAVSDMSDQAVNSALEEAKRYNESLNDTIVLTDPFDSSAYEKIGEGYEDVLNVDNAGLIGYIEIPKIDVYLPVRHGTSESILAHGAGHLQNTSFPIGGENTHSVISAHSGYPGETFFDYLTDIEVGDVFYVHVMNQTLKYEVDSIKVVLPEDTSDLRIVQGEDYVTLVTCTPYSINTHRLLVRGTRVEYNEEAEEDSVTDSVIKSDNGYIYIIGYRIPYWAAALIIAAFVLTVVLIVIFSCNYKRKKSKHSADTEILSSDENNLITEVDDNV